ncbi:MAG: hypothetical protein LBI30_01810 [Holosporales bacterium]|jgi:hypothetical protein|nr:hypothetical protein [Holosporales bacterium]
MSNCNWPLILTKFLISNLQEICEVFTYHPSKNKVSSYAVLEIDEITPATPIDKAKTSFRLHINNGYIGNQEFLTILQRITKTLTDKIFDLADEEMNVNAKVCFKYAGKERGTNTCKFEGLIRQIRK